MRNQSSAARSAMVTSVFMLATSSTCSRRNHSMNCSPRGSDSARAAWNMSSICRVTCFSCSSARRSASAGPLNRASGAGTAGIVTGMSRSSMYWTIIIAWFRSPRLCE